MIEILSQKLNEAGVFNHVDFRGSVMRQIRLQDGDIVEGFGIDKLETSGFGRGIVEGLEVDEALRLVLRTPNPDAAQNFRFDMPPGVLITEEEINRYINTAPPASFWPGYFQMGEVHEYVFNPATGKNEPVFATFIKIKFDTWQWKGYCLRGRID